MADQRERYGDAQEAMRVAMDGQQAGMWTALPATVTAYDAAKMTISAQPVVKAKQQAKDGTVSDVTMPLCVDVPVSFPKGGGYAMTFPIAVGDEVLLVFASRCIDGWWQQGGTQPQLDQRMHDLSDAIAIPGPWSQKTKLSGVSTSAVQIRSSDGSTVITLASGAVTINATTITLNGNVQINGTTLKHNAKNVGDTHTHSDPQGGSTGVPT